MKDDKGKWKPVFVKLHASLRFLYIYAEKMAVHLDLKNNEDLQKEVENDDSKGSLDCK